MKHIEISNEMKCKVIHKPMRMKLYTIVLETVDKSLEP